MGTSESMCRQIVLNSPVSEDDNSICKRCRTEVMCDENCSNAAFIGGLPQ